MIVLVLLVSTVTAGNAKTAPRLPRERVVIVSAEATSPRQARVTRERLSQALSARYEVVKFDTLLRKPTAEEVIEAARETDAVKVFGVHVSTKSGRSSVRVITYDPRTGTKLGTLRSMAKVKVVQGTTFWKKLAARLARSAPEPETETPAVAPTPEANDSDWDVAKLDFEDVAPAETTSESESLWDFDGRLDLQYHHFFNHNDSIPNDRLTGRQNIEARLGATFGTDEYFLRAEGDVRKDFATPERDRIAFIEAYGQGEWGPVTLRVGHQLTSWGATTLLTPGDIIDRVDYRDIVRPEKIASINAKLTLSFNRFQVELYALPRPIYHRMPFDVQDQLGGEPQQVPISLHDMQGAARFALSLPAFDASVAIAYMFDHVPSIAVALSPTGVPTMSIYQRRLWIATADFETTFGKWRWAFDGVGWKPEDGNRPFGRAVAGVDYLTAQFFDDQTLHFFLEVEVARLANTMGPGAALDGFRTPFSRSLVGQAVWDVGERVHTAVGGYFDLQHGSMALQATCEVKVFTATHMRVGVNKLSGPADTFFGHYKNDSRVFIEASAAF